MELKRIAKNNFWCLACDAKDAEVMISHNGRFKLFWASESDDPEICLCRDCFNKLKDLMNNFSFEDEASEMDEENAVPHSGPEY